MIRPLPGLTREEFRKKRDAGARTFEEFHPEWAARRRAMALVGLVTVALPIFAIVTVGVCLYLAGVFG